MPTFVEAILDTLTDRARQMVRVLRVRPSVHQRWSGKTHLNALESPARNIAVRRSNPKNRWILSTNTDMVFVMRDGSKSLSAAVKDLPRGYYGIPRFEMPESLWESLDRKDPRAVIGAFAHWGQALHLDEVVHSHKSILYDGPGDFQLVPRDDLIKIHGFSEAMLLGWHVDSNLAKRFLLLYGETKSLFHKVAGYHCDHTKVVTPAHGHDRQQNDVIEHISEVRQPEMPQQADTWGAPDAVIEDIRVPPGHDISFAAVIAPLLGPMPNPVYEVTYTEKSWNQITYPARHVIPYLADQIATFPRGIDLGYAGMNDTLRALLAETWRALGFTGRLLVDRGTAGVKPGCEPVPNSDAPYVVADLDYMLEHAALFILDLGVEDGPGWPIKLFHLQGNPKAKPLLPFMKAIQAVGMEIAAAERRRMAERMPARRVIFVNTINAEFAGQVQTVFGQTITPYCTRVRHGTLKPDATDALHQRRADVERFAATAAKSVMDVVEKPLPFELLDQAEPHALLSEQQRAEIAAAIPRREFIAAWRDVATLSLAKSLGDFDQRLAEYLAIPSNDSSVFLERLMLLRVASSEAMSRPWPTAAAAIITRACAMFLESTASIPSKSRVLAIGTMLTLCRGVSRGSLGALVECVVAHAGKRLSAAIDPSDATDAWIALCTAEFALSRPPWSSDAKRLDALRERLLTPALRRLAAPAPATRGRDSGGRIAVIATAPFARAVDPAATRLAEVLASTALPDGTQIPVRIFPLYVPDAAFLTQARRQGVEAAIAPDLNGMLASHVASRMTVLADSVRAWSPSAAIGVGDSALAPALLALGVAPRQAIYGNRLAADGIPEIGRVLTDQAAVGAWLRADPAPSGAKGSTVGVAAR